LLVEGKEAERARHFLAE